MSARGMSKHKVAKRTAAKKATHAVSKRVSKKPTGDRTDWKRLRAMMEEEVLAAAWSDEDAQPATESELEEFRPIPTVDVKAVRRRLGLSQAAFAARFGVNLRTVQDWEQGRRRPEGPARLLLAVIERDPEVVPRVLGAPEAKAGKARKQDIHVVPHPAGGWATRREGATRASARHQTQRAAIAAARVRATRERVAVVVHRRDGSVRAGAG